MELGAGHLLMTSVSLPPCVSCGHSWLANTAGSWQAKEAIDAGQTGHPPGAPSWDRRKTSSTDWQGGLSDKMFKLRLQWHGGRRAKMRRESRGGLREHPVQGPWARCMLWEQQRTQGCSGAYHQGENDGWGAGFLNPGKGLGFYSMGNGKPTRSVVSDLRLEEESL